MNSDEDFEPVEDEEAPESLRRKWEKEDFQDEFSGKKQTPCPHCKMPIDLKSFSCLYCGQTVFSKSGLLGRLAHSMGGGMFAVIVVVLLALSLLFLFLF